ncbi:hypothetical protein PFNF54_02742 [Plasmodium falciparum NF54]|uniref:Uncharacterized protein n=1 Tax=Plasmodium falciparum (isolate NF54) TaxID=5843 RepID=W7JU07_PLAFO|nr:hypothetical protein PFNF54_02742 [Plasmodium falciparum NF54]
MIENCRYWHYNPTKMKCILDLCVYLKSDGSINTFLNKIGCICFISTILSRGDIISLEIILDPPCVKNVVMNNSLSNFYLIVL